MWPAVESDWTRSFESHRLTCQPLRIPGGGCEYLEQSLQVVCIVPRTGRILLPCSLGLRIVEAHGIRRSILLCQAGPQSVLKRTERTRRVAVDHCDRTSYCLLIPTSAYVASAGGALRQLLDIYQLTANVTTLCLTSSHASNKASLVTDISRPTEHSIEGERRPKIGQHLDVNINLILLLSCQCYTQPLSSRCAAIGSGVD
jgi:hypothetical protein